MLDGRTRGVRCFVGYESGSFVDDLNMYLGCVADAIGKRVHDGPDGQTGLVGLRAIW
jgi:hypothetical protein